MSERYKIMRFCDQGYCQYGDYRKNKAKEEALRALKDGVRRPAMERDIMDGAGAAG